jgi:antitoxin component YwqK of YwqJK toxin-antitoxin module
MRFIFILFVVLCGKIYSQEVLKNSEIFKKDNLVYKTENSQLFSGKTQSFKNNNHLLLEREYINGIFRKYIIYFNGKEKIVSDEEYYNDVGNLEKKIKYSLDHKTQWIKYYNEYGNKILEEDYKNGILIYSCPYTNGKKNGIAFTINENGERNECKYENGKLIKKPNG